MHICFRHNILIGIASGLAYLHSECTEAIVHRDIKPANVMLNEKFNAKLSDFGLVTKVRHTQTSRPTDSIIGTYSYMDPAYTETGKVSGQCDVYSLGVVLLEIVCGQKPLFLKDSGKNNLIEMVRECDGRGRIFDAADKQLRGEFDQEMEAVLRLGLQCVLPDRHKRPHVGRVKDRLTELLANRKASTYQRQQSEGEFGTCRTTFRRHSQADEEDGVLCLLAE
jgi:serine/threonine protein kinase